MATPKLALIPTGYKAGKLYSVLPESGVGDFTVVRATEATRVNEEGLIETMGANVPRLDYSGGGCPVLLTEPQRSNLVTYSEDYSQSVWTKSKTTIISNSVVSPNGTLTADKLVEDTAFGEHIVYDLLITSSGNFSHSIFAKAAERSKIRISSGSNLHKVDFDLSNGSIILEVGATGSIDSMANGWYKLTLSWNESSSVPQYAFVSLLDDNGLDSYQGNGSSGLYIWGSQYEVGSYPTSYIKTEGSAVTRNGDQVNGAGDAATFNDSEGVLMVETKGENDNTFNYISLSDGGTTNYAAILYTDTDNQIIYRYYVGGSGVAITVNSIDVTNFNKIAIKWKANDFAIWINGIEVGTTSSGSLNPSGTFNELAFARGGANNTPFYGNTKQVQYFNTVLTDSELETLTSWTSFIEMAQAQNYNII